MFTNNKHYQLSSLYPYYPIALDLCTWLLISSPELLNEYYQLCSFHPHCLQEYQLYLPPLPQTQTEEPD